MREINRPGGNNFPDFRLYYKAIVIKTVWRWHNNRNIDQRNKIESPEINPCTMDTLFLTKKARIYNGEKTVFFNKWCLENWTATCKQMKLGHFLTPYTRINSKYIKDLSVRPETIKLLGENIGSTLLDIHQSKILFDPSPAVMEIKTKINKWHLIKPKSFCIAMETINKMKRQPSKREK